MPSRLSAHSHAQLLCHTAADIVLSLTAVDIFYSLSCSQLSIRILGFKLTLAAWWWPTDTPPLRVDSLSDLRRKPAFRRVEFISGTWLDS